MQVPDALEQQGGTALQIKDPELRKKSLQTIVLVSHLSSMICLG